MMEPGGGVGMLIADLVVVVLRAMKVWKVFDVFNALEL